MIIEGHLLKIVTCPLVREAQNQAVYRLMPIALKLNLSEPEGKIRLFQQLIL